MPAPTALQRNPEKLAEEQTLHDAPEAVDEDMILTNDPPPQESLKTTILEPSDPSSMHMDTPLFKPEATQNLVLRSESRKVLVPPQRFTPLKTNWPKIYPPLVEHLKLQVRMNIKSKAVELRTSKFTTDSGALQKGADFIHAFTLGFDVDDAIALLRLDDLYIETFEIKVRPTSKTSVPLTGTDVRPQG